MTDFFTNFNPLFSVIIPVYNVEKYLNKCIDSVLIQEFSLIEIILVDDGSSDNSPAICDEYAGKDQRVKVIHKLNSGVSNARNVGINTAQGKYLIFLDSDDFWEGYNCLDNLVVSIAKNKADIILFGTQDLDYVTNERRITRNRYDIEVIQSSREGALKSLFKTRHFPRGVCVFAIKKEFIINNKLFFVDGIKSEDVDWLLNAFIHAKSFDAVNDAFHIYVNNRPGSSTSTADAKSVKDILFSVCKWQPILEANKNSVNKLFLSHLAIQYITSFLYYVRIPIEHKKELLSEIKKYRCILRYANRGKALVSRIIINIFGIQIGSGVLFNVFKILNKRSFLPFFKKVQAETTM